MKKFGNLAVRTISWLFRQLVLFLIEAVKAFDKMAMVFAFSAMVGGGLTAGFIIVKALVYVWAKS